jgi:hypothetical protein
MDLEQRVIIFRNKQMDILNMSKIELLNNCEELGILKYKSNNKSQLIELINAKQPDFAKFMGESLLDVLMV